MLRALLDNRTSFPLRRVRAAVRWTLEELDANLPIFIVRIVETTHHVHYGRFYVNPRARPQVWGSPRSWTVAPTIIQQHMMIGRVPAHPIGAHDRGFKSGPPPIDPKNWQESIVCIVAHEAMHLRQYLNRKDRKTRWSEVEAEWAEYRLLRRWRERKS